LNHSFIESFEDALFDLEDIALRATPGIREILKWNTRWDPALRVSFGRIIDIMAF
jgi:hypothetical protein